jgi:hypothetical protein
MLLALKAVEAENRQLFGSGYHDCEDIFKLDNGAPFLRFSADFVRV